MADFTYQGKDSTLALERYEWDRTWIERTENAESPRVMYLGDSISWGIRPEAQRSVGQEFLMDALATSKALDNPWYLPTWDLLLQQTATPVLTVVNNGLHGWHLKDEEEYGPLFRAFLEEVRKRCGKIAVVLTTCVADEARNLRVQTRNRVAARVARDLGCPVIDLYTPSLQGKHSDGVHFDAEGYRLLAGVLVENLRALLD